MASSRNWSPLADERVRLEIGFDGGQAMTVIVPGQDADELEQRLAAGTEQTVALDADDGRYTVALKRVAYVKRFARESRVGF
jgi:hypothetical protein